jgi:signal transduction histidine kinase
MFALTGVALLALALTSLSLHAVNANAETFDLALTELNRFTKNEGVLRGDLLAARAGLLRNYDPVVQQVDAISVSLDRLRDIAAGDPRVLAGVEELAAAAARQNQIVEQFKSDNALLQNSLTHFARIGRSLEQSGRTAAVPQISAAVADILHLSLDPSPELLSETQGLLDGLEASVPAQDPDQIEAFLAHAHLLLRLLPQMDNELRSLTMCIDATGALRGIVRDEQIMSRTSARHYRFLLYAASLLLTGALIYLALCLHERAIAGRRRIAFERAIAAISARFVSTPPHNTEAAIQQGLAELARCVGADRAYLLLPDMGPRTFLWCRPGINIPPRWPDGAPELARKFGEKSERIVQIGDVRRLRAGAKKDDCLAVGLRGWSFASGASSRGRAFLGFDAVTHPCRITHPGELGVLPMALDLLVSAVERRLTELEKSKLEQRLQQTRRMETVGALASGVAHNFNNIIAAILGYVEMAEAQVEPSSRHGRHLSAIRRAGERGRDVVEQLLRFGRRRNGRRWPIEVQAIMAESESFLRASLPPDIGLVFHEAPAGAGVVAEPAQLQQVVLNLCSNAAQAMEGCGTIDVETTLRDLPDAQDLTHGTLEAGRYVVIAVTDAGPGIDQVVLTNLFEPFFTTRANGNGLGLATVREIVDEHGGGINVLSHPGQGSRFEIWLPCSTAGQAAEIDSDKGVFGRGQSVLLVGSSREQLLHDEEILAALGYEPIGFWRAADAVAACRAKPDRFDAILIGSPLLGDKDTSLPRLLHILAPRRPILVAAESTESFDIDALVTAGVSEIVTRPISADEIAAVLARCLKASAESAPAIRTKDRVPTVTECTTYTKLPA